MEQTIDVMLIESRPAAGERAAAQLEASGHRVHRCREVGDPQGLCRGAVDPEACPVAEGAQVALVAYDAAGPGRDGIEQGVSCALRGRIPVVEQGEGLVDLLDPWVSARAGRDPVRACVEAVRRSFDPLRAALWTNTAEVVEDAGFDATGLRWDVEVVDGGLHLVATGPPLDARARSRLAVRALDAARDARATSIVDVSYATAAPDERS